MNKKSLFFGGAFRDHQILYMIPILDGFCSKKKIKKIIFEKKLSEKILNVHYVKNFLNKYEILYLTEINKKNFNFFYKPLKAIFFSYFFFLSFLVNKKLLLRQNNDWFNCQLYHAIWDTCIVYNQKKLDNFELKSRVISSLQLAQKKIDIISLKKKNTSYAFIQHTVYSERYLFALLRKFNIKIFVQTKHVLIEQKKDEDFGFKYLNRKIFIDSFKFIKNRKILDYWSQILKGKSKYLEARIAANLKNKTKMKNFRENVLMLHIFRDSPFTNIDRERIFSDYYTWVVETLKILRKSKEKWIIRKHPSAERWGENQKKIVDEIFKKVFGKKVPKNIIFENNLKSNLLQFKHTKRLVTFSGNSHLEAACFGIKPIIISKTTLSDYGKNLYFKPKSILDYQKLLLDGKDQKFLITEKEILICKRILFLIHNVINFSEDVDSFHIFRSDPQKIFKHLFIKILDKTKKNYLNIFEIGKLITLKYNQSINLKYIRLFIKK